MHGGIRTLQINRRMLEELRLLFDNRRGGKLPNGLVDFGFNCYAKAFVTVFLARMQGIEAQACAGKAFLAWIRPKPSRAYLIQPHAWTRAITGAIIDLSINQVEGRDFFTSGHEVIDGLQPVNAQPVSQLEFDRLVSSPPRLPMGSHVFYHAERLNGLSFEVLGKAAAHINSPPTREIAGRYPRNNVIAKAVLHLHGLVAGDREPLQAFNQDDAWAQLARWDVDAMNEIEAACVTAMNTLRAGPPCEAA